MALTVTQHIAKIDEWVVETVEDREGSDYAVTADECYSDIVHAYLDTEDVSATMRRMILRATGLQERVW